MPPSTPSACPPRADRSTPRAPTWAAASSPQIEEHLRSGRLDEASLALSRLESEPGAEDRARKLRTRIEEALDVAAEHRREEEILIATAAIEERLRRGNIDDAAQRLADLAERHGSSAPVAELRERLAEARALAHQAGVQTGAAVGTVDDPNADRGQPASTIFQSMIDEEARGGRSRWIAIAVVVAIVIAGLWWWSQRSPSQTGDSVPGDAPAASDSATGAPANAADDAATSRQADSPASSDRATSRSGDAAPSTAAVDPRSAQSRSPSVVENSAAPRELQPEPAAGAGNVVPPAVVQQEPAAAPNEAADVDPAVDRGAQAAAPESPASATDENAAPATATDNATQVVVEAVPASEAPPPEPAPPPAEPAIESSSGSDSPAAAADPAAAAPVDAAPARTEESEPVPAPADSQQAAAAPAPAAPPPAPAAAPASTGPAMLGCGEPGVVCLKAIHVPTPSYPAAARARRLNANVVVMALVDERGRVVQTRIDSGSFPFFNEAATEAAKRATFSPATRQGVPGTKLGPPHLQVRSAVAGGVQPAAAVRPSARATALVIALPSTSTSRSISASVMTNGGPSVITSRAGSVPPG